MQAQINNMVLSLGILAIFGVITYYTITRKSGKITDAICRKSKFYLHLIKLITGILLLGVIPLYTIKIADSYLPAPEMNGYWIALLLLLSALIFSASAAAAMKFPLTGQAERSVKPLLVIYFPLRIVFLAAYEIFFRGTLLPLLLLCFSQTMSVAVNTFLYALLHAGSGKQEWLGAIPFGITLCYLTINTASVWPAVWLHLLLAMVYETVVLKKLFSTNNTAVV